MRILILSSSSQHFPLDIQTVLKGYECHRLDSLNEFISSPLRNEPFLGVLEVGTTEDVDRALIAYEWAETVQPLAAARFLLLVGSKHISLQEKAGRFRGVEVAQLPLPPKNLLFKVELQLRVLANEKKPAEKKGFRAEFEGAEKERVLVLKGPGPKEGSWNAAGEAPQGKTRWRWIDNLLKTESDFDWSVESRKAPEFDSGTDSWKVKEPDADLQCHRSGEEVYSANKAASAASPGPDASSPKAKEASPLDPKPAGILASPQGPGSPATPNPSANSSASSSSSPAIPQPKGKEEPKKEATPANKPAPEGKRATEPTPLSPSEKPAAPSGKPSLSSSAPARPAEAKPQSAPLKLSDSSPAHEPKAAPAPPSQPAAAPPTPKENAPASASSSAPASLSSSPGQAPSAPQAKIAGEASSSANQELKTSQPARPTSGLSTSLSAPSSPSSLSSSPPSPQGERPEGKTPTAPANEAQQKNESTQREAPSKPTEQETKNPFPLPPSPEPELEPEPGPKSQEHARPAPASKPPEAAPPSSGAQVVASPSPSAGEKPISSGLETKQPVPPSAIQKERPQAPGPSPETKVEQGRPTSEKISTTSAERKESTGKIVISRNDNASTHQNFVRASEPPDRENETRMSGKGDQDAQGAQSLTTRLFHTMTLEELQDKNSSWHPVEGYRLYLAAEYRYYGMKDSDDLFPLWVYEGELAPEFLDLQKAWKFYDRLPVPYGSVETLPAPVARFLLDLMKGKPNEPLALAEEPVQEEPKKSARSVDGNMSAQSEMNPKTKAAPPSAALPAAKQGQLFSEIFRLLRKLLGL